MSITSRTNKPNEFASKINQTHIINDPFMKEYVSKLSFPSKVFNLENVKGLMYEVDTSIKNPIEHILAVDGGYTLVEVNKNFPSSQVAFFQFGALWFKAKDLKNLSTKPFIFPEDMNKLQTLQRIKLALPIKNTNYDNSTSLTHAFRKSLYEFFMNFEDGGLMETLSWVIFEKYNDKRVNSDNLYKIASNPYHKNIKSPVSFNITKMLGNYTFDHEDGVIYLTDVFRLHEAIDDEVGAGGVLGYVTRVVEQFILVHFIRILYEKNRAALHNFLFIADGPLSFSGQTANMHKPLRRLCNFLLSREQLYLVGIEKSGEFVDHVHEIATSQIPLRAMTETELASNRQISNSRRFLKNNYFLPLSSTYIYTYVSIGDPNSSVYAGTSYYGGKVLYHSVNNQKIVLTIPVTSPDIYTYKMLPDNPSEYLSNYNEKIYSPFSFIRDYYKGLRFEPVRLKLNEAPQKSNYRNVDIILQNISLLKCDMYDNSIVPIALANKLVSLSNHPTQTLLTKFAIDTLK